VASDDVIEAARIIGTADRLLSTVLQRLYQSNQATAAACGVNNIHLLRGMIGKPGAGVLQMNGQPTAQNTRETGADGDLSGMRNWDNLEHIEDLTELWDVDPAVIPHWAPPTHAMQIWRYAEQGSIELLWISGTNPCVSLPDLGRIRRILRQDGLMVVVQDLFLTETAELADVVLPGATGERRPAPSPMRTAPFTSPRRPSTRPARRGPTWTSFWTTRAGWTSAIGAASRSCRGTIPSRPSRPGRPARAAGRATTPS
jgi:anaerobic selenocysteine-containing dehydrogenase